MRVAWRTLVRAGLGPAAVTERLDDLMALEAVLPAQFTTMGMIRFVGPDRIGIVLAGHPPPFLLHDGEVTPLPVEAGPPLGLGMKGWTEHEVDVPDGSSVLAFTDGLIEGRVDPNGPERMGMTRVAALIACSPSRRRRSPRAPRPPHGRGRGTKRRHDRGRRRHAPRRGAPARGARILTMSLRQRLRLLLAASAVVLALIIVFGAVSFRNLTNAQNDLIDRIQVARIAAKNLELALIDQETGLRGFVLSRDGSFLQPYQSGLEAETRARRDIGNSLPDDASVQRDLATITSHAEQWRSQIVGPALTAVSQGRRRRGGHPAEREGEAGVRRDPDATSTRSTSDWRSDATSPFASSTMPFDSWPSSRPGRSR